MASTETLKRTCTGFGLRLALHTHWTKQATEANTTVSVSVNIAVEISTNRKFVEMVPVIPGNRTFRAEESRANAKQLTDTAKSAKVSELTTHPTRIKLPATMV